MHIKERSHARRKGAAGQRSQSKALSAEQSPRQPHPATLIARAGTHSLTPRDVLQLQSAFGNRAVTRLLAEVPRREATRAETTAGRATDRIERDGNQPAEALARNRADGNRGDLPDKLKAGVERLSGVSLDDVQVRYNSSAPARVNALAYTQGTEIHLGPGQDRHLAHEAWHVVQQRQGRVRPTLQSEGLAINNDRGLEREADLMGDKAAVAAQPAEELVARGESAAVQLKGGGVVQLFSVPPGNPPNAGVRGRHLNGDNVPDESHITTIDGQNDLIGTAPGVAILGWNYIQAVGASGPWVRFHLVNEQIGGLGDQNNLVPTSHATNHLTDWRNFERTCQYYEGQQTGMHVTVEVYYPARAAHAGQGTLQANQHFYPNRIRGRCYLWDANANAYQLHNNGAPANRNTYRVDINPFPLQPPANANITNLTQQTAGWLRNTLMAGNITAGQGDTLHDALQGNYMGDDVQTYIAQSQEPTTEMELLDALDSFLAVELNLNIRVPANARVQILNGSYRL
jgi:hypothetical protein